MPNRSFFSRFKGFIKWKGSANPEGRYLAECLKEVLLEDPGLTRVIWPHASTNLRPFQPVTEHPYVERRLADLAMVDRDGEAKALLEVKMEDCFLMKEGKGHQLDDYVAFSKKAGCPLSVLSRHPLRPEDEARAAEAGAARFSLSDLRSEILSRQNAARPVARMLCEFLGETEMVYHAQIPIQGVHHLLTRIFLDTNKSTVVSLKTWTLDVPEGLEALTSSMHVVAQEVARRIRMGQRPPPRMRPNWRFFPRVDTGRVRHLAKSAKDGEYISIADAKKGQRSGEARLEFAANLADSSDWCSLMMGLVAEVQPKSIVWKLGAWIDADGNWESYAEAPGPNVRGKPLVLRLGKQEALVEKFVALLQRSQKQYLSFYEGRKGQAKPLRHLETIRKLNMA